MGLPIQTRRELQAALRRAGERIAELEGELEAERELLDELALAYEALQGQLAAAGNGLERLVPPEAGAAPEKPPAQWGVPLESFPVAEPQAAPEGNGSESAGAEQSALPRLRRLSRRR